MSKIPYYNGEPMYGPYNQSPRSQFGRDGYKYDGKLVDHRESTPVDITDLSLITSAGYAARWILNSFGRAPK